MTKLILAALTLALASCSVAESSAPNEVRGIALEIIESVLTDPSQEEKDSAVKCVISGSSFTSEVKWRELSQWDDGTLVKFEKVSKEEREDFANAMSSCLPLRETYIEFGVDSLGATDTSTEELFRECLEERITERLTFFTLLESLKVYEDTEGSGSPSATLFGATHLCNLS